MKTSYFYDASAERLLRTGADGATTLYVGETELTVKADGTESVQRSYTHPDGATTVRSSDGGREVLLADYHGSTQASVDMIAAGMPVTRRLLTPFGEDRGAAPSTWPGYRDFVGGTRDQDTGLTQLGARPYDPATGRFLSVDPMVDYQQPATINPYAYSNNAPATFSDPDGLFFPILIGIAARIAIQAAIRAAARRAAQIAARKAAEAIRKRALAEARKRAVAAARKKAAAKAKREAARKAAAAKRAAAKRAAQRAAAKRAAARQAAARANQRAQRAAAKRAQAARAAARKAKPKPRPQPKSQPKPSQKAKPAQQKKASPKQSAGRKAREEIKSEARGQAEDAVAEQSNAADPSAQSGDSLSERLGSEGVASVLIDTLQLEVDIESREVLFAWGYFPNVRGVVAESDAPQFTPGRVFVSSDHPFEPGVSFEVPGEGWQVSYDPSSGWVTIRLEKSTDPEFVQIAGGTVLGIEEGNLVSVRLNPVFAG